MLVLEAVNGLRKWQLYVNSIMKYSTDIAILLPDTRTAHTVNVREIALEYEIGPHRYDPVLVPSGRKDPPYVLFTKDVVDVVKFVIGGEEVEVNLVPLFTIVHTEIPEIRVYRHNYYINVELAKPHYLYITSDGRNIEDLAAEFLKPRYRSSIGKAIINIWREEGAIVVEAMPKVESKLGYLLAVTVMYQAELDKKDLPPVCAKTVYGRGQYTVKILARSVEDMKTLVETFNKLTTAIASTLNSLKLTEDKG